MTCILLTFWHIIRLRMQQQLSGADMSLIFERAATFPPGRLACPSSALYACSLCLWPVETTIDCSMLFTLQDHLLALALLLALPVLP